MELPTYFDRFLKEIRPTQNQRDDCRTGHQTLRNRLHADEGLKSIVVSTFLQGSYRRATAVRPKEDSRSDVDIIVVTRLNRDDYQDPDKAMDLFVPFLKRHYVKKYRRQGRSFGIELSYVDLDLVITSAPSEAEQEINEIYVSKAVTADDTPEDVDDWRLVSSWIPLNERNTEGANVLLLKALAETEWKTEPLWIPNRDVGEWERTHPLEQIKWTWGKNARCNKHYVNVVRVVKWWQKVNHKDDRPKGYPLEHIIGVCCPDGIESVAEGVALTLESIACNYKCYAEKAEVPCLPDHGVPEHDVFDRVEGSEFAELHEHVSGAAKTAREALDADTTSVSAGKWRELLGSKFPSAPDDGKQGDDSQGPFVPPSPRTQTGDQTPRRYGQGS